MSLTTRKMSDAHEDWLVEVLGGRKMKGSGNQWHNPMDGRHSQHQQHYAFAWDGKSTLGKSVGVTREMWAKAREQAMPLQPLLPLRWYRNERLEVDLDLVVVETLLLAEILADANRWQAAKEQGCLIGIHRQDLPDNPSECVVCGVDLYDTVGS